jgi:arylsulfatase A-like enzyme
LKRGTRILAGAAALAAATLALVVAATRPAARPAPHILLISVDALRRDALRAFDAGAQPLPALDALAAESTHFTQAYSPASWTLPSHASLLTGVYPHRHGAVHKQATLSAAVPTVAEGLAAAGYETVAFTDGGFVDHKYGLGRGFARYDNASSNGQSPPEWLPDGGKPPFVRGFRPFARVEAYLRQRTADRPLFLFAHTYALHDYYYGTPWARRALASPDGVAHGTGEHPEDVAWVADGTPRAAEMARNLACLLGSRRCSDAEWQTLRELYAGELRHLDGALGALLQTARAELGDRPLWIVLTSDHGEGFDPAAGAAHHGGVVHPDVLAIPLLISGPGVRRAPVTAPVSLVDLAPTLLGLAGAPTGDDLDGHSLQRLLDGPPLDFLTARKLARRTLLAEDHYYWWTEGARESAREVPGRAFAVATTRNGWWYSRAMGRESVLRLGQGWQDDPSPRATSDRETIAALRLEAAAALHERPTATAGPAADPEREKLLESLGYLASP